MSAPGARCCASHSLNGSAFGEGMDWMMRRSCSVSATSVRDVYKRQALHEAHPDVDIYLGAQDDHLNENGYIVPGLGDAGDRIYGTK